MLYSRRLIYQGRNHLEDKRPYALPAGEAPGSAWGRPGLAWRPWCGSSLPRS
jgi:hypothetical protein